MRGGVSSEFLKIRGKFGKVQLERNEKISIMGVIGS